MVKKYSKKTFKRKNKISRRKSSKRKHSRNKKKKTKKNKDKTKRANDYGKAGMSPSLPEPPPLQEPPPLPGSEPEPEPDLGPPITVDKERVAAEGMAEGLRVTWGAMPSGDYITWENIAHNSLQKIHEQINDRDDDVLVFVLIVSNHGTMEGALTEVEGHRRPPGIRRFIPENMSLVFNIIPGYSTSGGWPNSHKRNFVKEDLILHSLSDHIGTVGDLDQLFGHTGCLADLGERLNAALTKTVHNKYDTYEGLVSQIPDEQDAATLISERYDATGKPVKSYGILHKLQVYKEGEPYHDQSFKSLEKIDKDKLGIVFKFETENGDKYLYHNLNKGGFDFTNPTGKELDCIKLSNILEYISPLTINQSSGNKKDFIITYNSCREEPTPTQKAESREHLASDSVDCYIEKFNESDGETIRGKLKELGFENMILFYESLMDADRLDTFVTLKSDSEIVSFFQTLGDLSISLPVSEPEPESTPEPKQKPQKPSSKPPQKPQKPQKPSSKPPSKPKPQKTSSKPPSKPKPQKPSSKPPSKPKPLPSEEDPFFIGVPPDLPD